MASQKLESFVKREHGEQLIKIAPPILVFGLCFFNAVLKHIKHSFGLFKVNFQCALAEILVLSLCIIINCQTTNLGWSWLSSKRGVM